MKRTACIILWTTAAAVLGFEWNDLMLEHIVDLAQRIARASGNSGTVLRLVCLALDGLPWVFTAAVFIGGIMGRIPGTRRFSNNSSASVQEDRSSP